MNPINILVLLVSSYFLPEIQAATASTSVLPKNSRLSSAQRRALEIHRENVIAYVQKYCGKQEIGNPLKRNKFKRESSMDDADSDSSSGMEGEDSTKDSKMMTTLKGLIKRIPQTNFYSSIPNAIGVIGQGYSVLQTLTTALGTPLPYYIGALPVTLFGIALMFIPDLTTLNLPGFYPSGAGENDPLSAFPPLPDLDGLPDVDLSLSPDNIPPRIIPPGETSSNNSGDGSPSLVASQDESEFLSNQLPPAELQEEDAVSPTNPESFQAPRRRVGVNKEGVPQDYKSHTIIRDFHRHQQHQMPPQMNRYHQQYHHHHQSGPRVLSQHPH